MLLCGEDAVGSSYILKNMHMCSSVTVMHAAAHA